MKHEVLLIVFSKNADFGKVKTRLAENVGDENAHQIFKVLSNHTKSVVEKVSALNIAAVEIHLSDRVNDTDWSGYNQILQAKGDLGTKMETAFENGFKNGFKKVIGIGTDLPELSVQHITDAISELENHELAFGPSKDGGYYLIGMQHFIKEVFQNIDWSTEHVLEQSLQRSDKYSSCLLKQENDIDTIDDLINSPGIKTMYAELLCLINNKRPY